MFFFCTCSIKVEILFFDLFIFGIDKYILAILGFLYQGYLNNTHFYIIAVFRYQDVITVIKIIFNFPKKGEKIKTKLGHPFYFDN